MNRGAALMILLVILIPPGCTYLGLNPSVIKGSEARDILKNRLAAFFVKDITDSNGTNVLLDLFIPALANIQDDRNYRRRDVEHCASLIYLVGLAIDQPRIAQRQSSDPASRFFPPVVCNLQPVEEIF